MGILLGILAAVGKVLLIILLIVLVLLALILFVPIRYQAAGEKENGILRGSAKVTWLLGFISFNVSFKKRLGSVEKSAQDEEINESPDGVETSFKILGISPKERKKKKEEDRRRRRKEKKKEKIEEIKAKDPDQYERLREEARQRHEERLAAKKAEEERMAREAKEAKEAEVKAEEKKKLIRRMQLRLYYSMGVVYRFFHALWSTASGIFKICMNIILFLAGLPSAIAERIGNFFNKLSEVISDIEKWVSFLSDPRFTHTVGLVFGDIKKLLGHILPRKLEGEAAFGMEDPGTTGEILAAVSAFYPKYGGKIKINPDFSGRSYFEFDLNGSGRIYLFYIAYLLLGLVFSRDVRYVWHFIKDEKKTQGDAA